MEKIAASSRADRHCPCRLQRLPNDIPFREPNSIAVKILCNASVRPEESAPLVSRATKPGGRILAGSKQIPSILKLLADQAACSDILQSSRADPSPLGLTK